MPDIANEKEVSDVLGLSKVKERDWAIFKCSGKTGTGLN